MPTTAETIDSIWQHIGAQRAKGADHHIIDALTELASGNIPGSLSADVIEGLLYKNSTPNQNAMQGENSSPPLLSSFMAKLAAQSNPATVLDPACGLGVTLARIAEELPDASITGAEVNVASASIACGVNAHGGTVHEGRVFQAQEINDNQYDLIVADAPLGYRIDKAQLPDDLQALNIRDFGQNLAVWCCDHLASGGLAAIVMTQNTFFKPNKLQKSINSRGYKISAVLHVPGNTRLNTSIPSLIVIIQAGEQKDFFVGQISEDDQHNERLLANFKRTRADKHPSLGRLCNIDSFISYEALEAEHQLRQIVRQTTLQKYRFSDLLRETITVKRLEGQQEEPSAADDKLFLDQRRLRLYQDPSSLPEKTERYTCLHFDTAKVNSRYLQQWFETETGKLALKAAGSTSMTGVNPMTTTVMESLQCYLPAIEDQRQTLDAQRELIRLRTEIHEVEADFFNGRSSGRDLLEKANSVNKEYGYEDWLETLPYPLASVLWRHKISGDDPRIRFGILLHFFEAFAEFVATIHLSAYCSHEPIWRTHQSDLLKKLSNQNLSLERATFGTWKIVVEFLGSISRKMLEDKDTRLLVQKMYANQASWLETLCASKLNTVISTANGIRNKYSGHSGAMGASQAEEIEQELMALIEQIRMVFGRNWQAQELVIADRMEYTDGEYTFQTPLLLGTRSQFQRVERTTTVPMDTGKLYLLTKNAAYGLKLLPFVRVMSSPKNEANACYFYNRVEPEGQRFVSYHFEQEAEVHESFEDTAQAVRQLTIVPTPLGMESSQ